MLQRYDIFSTCGLATDWVDDLPTGRYLFSPSDTAQTLLDPDAVFSSSWWSV